MTLARHGRQSAFLTALLFAFAMTVTPAAAADAPKVKPTADSAPKHVLFVGNSYLYYGDSLHNHVRRMAAAADAQNAKQYRYKSVTISAGSLDDHDVDSYLKPGRLAKEPFEVVVLQGKSSAALSEKGRAEFASAVSEIDKVVRKHGARTALYMTHAYVKPHKKADPAMIGEIEKLYVATGNKLGALVIPVGLAFEEAYKERPGIKLQKQYDGSHPDLIGTYLAACVVYASLYDRSPVGNPYDYYGAIDKDTALFLQKVAEKTVRKFYGQPLAEAVSAK
jgi:hypothetical protein